MVDLNELIHQPVRLRIMAALVTLEGDLELEFTYLRDLLDVTDGNLGAHLRKLEEAGYVELVKTFVARKPHTYIAITAFGRNAFEKHVSALEAITSGEESRAN
ncbi:MAG TPA: helix-turn-helix domain-containing protein [Anaerolineae bacterium]|nr:helix-turn-helix domain-containing protein [Anaerolineae bacterium]